MFAHIAQLSSDKQAAIAKSDSLSPSHLKDQINQGFEERLEVTIHDFTDGLPSASENRQSEEHAAESFNKTTLNGINQLNHQREEHNNHRELRKEQSSPSSAFASDEDGQKEAQVQTFTEKNIEKEQEDRDCTMKTFSYTSVGSAACNGVNETQLTELAQQATGTQEKIYEANQLVDEAVNKNLCQNLLDSDELIKTKKKR